MQSCLADNAYAHSNYHRWPKTEQNWWDESYLEKMAERWDAETDADLILALVTYAKHERR